MQTGGAKAIDRQAADRDGAIGHERDLARDVGAGRTLGIGATDDDILDFGGVNTGARNRVLDRVAAECGAMGHVECASPAFSQRRACS